VLLRFSHDLSGRGDADVVHVEKPDEVMVHRRGRLGGLLQASLDAFYYSDGKLSPNYRPAPGGGVIKDTPDDLSETHILRLGGAPSQQRQRRPLLRTVQSAEVSQVAVWTTDSWSQRARPPHLAMRVQFCGNFKTSSGRKAAARGRACYLSPIACRSDPLIDDQLTAPVD